MPIIRYMGSGYSSYSTGFVEAVVYRVLGRVVFDISSWEMLSSKRTGILGTLLVSAAQAKSLL